MTYDVTTSNDKKKFFFLLPAIGLFLFASIVRAQSTCDSTCDPGASDYQTCLTTLAGLCQSKVSQLQGQANTLANQIAQFNAQIKLATLKISQTEDQITLLGGRIDQLGDSLTSLTAAFSARVVETYKLSKFENNFIFILSASDLSDAVSRFHYLQKIEEEDRSLLEKLQTAQTTYQGQKADQETLQAQLKSQEANLNAQKIAKNTLLVATQNNESKYQALLLQARKELAALSQYASGKTSTAANQTVCDDWGCYYAQGDPAWGNMMLGNSGYTVTQAGCLITSSAMIATHYKKNLTPADVDTDSSAGWLSKTITVNGTTITRISIGADPSNVNTTIANIDSELSAGRPVIVGLTGPHFIVLRSGSNGNYKMNDPLGKDIGYDKDFSSRYSLSNIIDVEKVNVN
jgi:peptidoglycan hydrolase CwlO-like protein